MSQSLFTQPSYQSGSRKRKSTPLRTGRYRKKAKTTMVTYTPTPRRYIPLGKPASNVARLRYCEHVVLNAGTGGIAEYVFRINSLFDPDFTGTGHQPMGFDQFGAFYSRYVVIGAKVNIRVTQGGTAVAYGPGSITGAYISPGSAAAAADLISLLEQGRSNSTMVAHAFTKGNDNLSFNINFSPKRFFGITNIKDNIDNIGAVTSANPSTLAYLHIFTGSMDTAAFDPGVQHLIVTIEFLCLFDSPRTLPQS